MTKKLLCKCQHPESDHVVPSQNRLAAPVDQVAESFGPDACWHIYNNDDANIRSICGCNHYDCSLIDAIKQLRGEDNGGV